MANNFQYLFSPIAVGPVTVPNRIVSTPHSTWMGKDWLASEQMAYYLAEKAKGGTGLIEIEGVWIDPAPIPRHAVRTYDPSCIPGLRLVADMIHEHGAKVFCEILHSGVWGGNKGPSVAVDLMGMITPRVSCRQVAMHEIEEWIEAYAVTARHLREAHIDGIELHATHGVGIHEFNSPLYNRRTDKYGGTLEKRLTFMLEVIDRVREEVGNDMALGVRLDADEPLGGNTLEDAQKIARILEATGKIDYLSVDTAFEPTQEYLMAAPMYAPHGHMVYAAAAMKEVVEIPVIVAGRIIDPLHAEKILADGQADLVGMTRAQFADPELANKARHGRLDDIRTCLGCNENCWGGAAMRRACTVNPAIGMEKELGSGTLRPAPQRKKVAIIGGGPAGMEAARIATLRGHQVTIYEKGDDLGGQVNLASRLPGRSEIGGIVRWLKGQLGKLDVDIRLGQEMTAETVKEIKPDVVVVATGAVFFRDGLSGQTLRPIRGWEQDNVTTPEEILAGRRTAGQRVVIIDETGSIVGPGLGELLADQGKEVEIVTSDPFVGMNLLRILHLPYLYPRIMPKLTLSPLTVVKEITGSTIVAVNPYTRQERTIKAVDTVVLVTGKEPLSALWRELIGKVPELYLAGDCDRAPNAVDGIGSAIRSAHLVGRQI